MTSGRSGWAAQRERLAGFAEARGTHLRGERELVPIRTEGKCTCLTPRLRPGLELIPNTRDRLNTLVWVAAGSLAYFGVKGGLFAIVTGGSYRLYGPDGSFIADNNAMGLALVGVGALHDDPELIHPSEYASNVEQFAIDDTVAPPPPVT